MTLAKAAVPASSMSSQFWSIAAALSWHRAINLAGLCMTEPRFTLVAGEPSHLHCSAACSIHFSLRKNCSIINKLHCYIKSNCKIYQNFASDLIFLRWVTLHTKCKHITLRSNNWGFTIPHNMTKIGWCDVGYNSLDDWYWWEQTFHTLQTQRN